MSEQELIRVLQEVMARQPAATEARRLSAEIIRRDHGRVRLLAGFTALLWLAGVAGLLYMVFWFNRFIIAYAPVEADPKEAWRTGALFHAKMELHHSLEGCLVAVPALLLAALGTVWLVFSSRRATLNQINLSLAAICEQLRQIRQPARPPEGG